MPNFEKKLHDVELNVGKAAKFDASVTGIPTPTVTWHKDGQPIESNDNIKIEQRGNSKSLTIKKTSTDNVGAFTIVAKNEVGEDFCTANLNVTGESKTTFSHIFH